MSYTMSIGKKERNYVMELEVTLLEDMDCKAEEILLDLLGPDGKCDEEDVMKLVTMVKTLTDEVFKGY